MAQKLSVVGKRLPRPDAVEKATGTAKYIPDLKLPGMLIGKVLRSPYPHAKVLKVNTSKAEKLPGVEVVITKEDAPARPYSQACYVVQTAPQPAPPFLIDQHLFDDKVRFVGDAVAAVAAINESVAEKALELIEVEYEKLPAVFDPVEAMKPGAPRIHDFAENNIALHMTFPFAKGDAEHAFQEADCIVEGSFNTSKQIHGILGPVSAIASFDARGRLTVWSNTQHIHITRGAIANLFGMPEGMIRVLNLHVGGSFGSQMGMIAEPYCIALAKKAGKPVKLECTQEEGFAIGMTRSPFRYHLKMGFKKDGTLIATKVKAITHLGGYLGHSLAVTGVYLDHCLGGNYRCPNTTGEADLVYTNTTPSGAMRGFGNPAATFGLEQLMDMAAEKLGLDPVELRLKNIKKVGEPSPHGPPTQSTAQAECIRTGAEKIGWQEKRVRKGEVVKRRGVGMATFVHVSGPTPQQLDICHAFIKLNEDGSANLTVCPLEMGQGILGALAQIAAEELGVCAEDIYIVTGDTDTTLFDLGSGASRSCHVIGAAVQRAAREAKTQLLKRAAEVLGASVDELEARDRRVYVKSAPERGMSVAEAVQSALFNFNQGAFHITGQYSFHHTTASPSTQACFAEVEVDTESGEVKVLKLVIAHDIGRAINPMTVEGQIEGGAAQGIGLALTEDFVIDRVSGTLMSNNFQNYKVPSSLDVPEIEVILVEKPDPVGPFGAKGVGEPALVGVPAAIANAIYNAVGVRITEEPITPERILAALKAKYKG